MANKKTKSDKQPALDVPQTADIAWLGNDWQEHPVLGMTPQRLHQLLTAAELGDLSAQADLFADFEERDGHLFAELSKRKRAVVGLPWSIVPPRNATDAEKKQAEQIKEWIDDIDDLEQILFDALDAIGHGYSCQEITWRRTGSLWLPASIEYQLPRHFMTPQEQPSELRLKDGSMVGAELWDFGWLNHIHKAKSGTLARSGLFRVLSWVFIFKNYSVRDLAQLLEIYGLPIRLGRYPSGATADEKMTLLRAVMQIGRNAGGIIPHGMDIVFEKAADGDSKNHMSMIEWCEKTMSKVILGSTLTTQADGASSTNALGKIHNEVRWELVESDGKQLARSLSDSIVSYLMRLNFPAVDPSRHPKFAFDFAQPEDITVFSDALPKLVDVGMQIPQQWAHEKLGIPMPEDDKTPVLSTLDSAPLTRLSNQTFNLAALSQDLKNTTYLDQNLLDQAIRELEANSLQAESQQIVDQILKQLEAVTSIDDALGLLAEMLPSVDPALLQDHLTRLLFAAETVGMISANDELSND